MPAGYRCEPAALSDATEIHALIGACERSMHGRAQTDVSHVVADLSRPGLDPRLDVRVVRDGTGGVVAWAWVKSGRRCTIDVHPAHTGRGLGSLLLDWAETRARQFGAQELGQTVPDLDTHAAVLLRERGYSPTAHQWLLEYSLTADPGEIRLPAGIVVRAFQPADAHDVYELCEDAFAFSQTSRRTFEEWSELTINRSTFVPTLSPLAFAGGELVGFIIALEDPDSDEGFVDQLAVREDHRGRGIAKALLQTTFRDFYRRGRSTTTLWTHSKLSALSVYEHIGMTVRRSDTIYHGSLGEYDH